MRTTFQQIPVDVFNAFGDVAVSTIYRRITLTYDPVTGVGNEVIDDYPTRGIQDEITHFDLDNLGLRTIDVRLMIPSLELPITPEAGDKFEWKSKWYEVVSMDTDPADAMYLVNGKEG